MHRTIPGYLHLHTLYLFATGGSGIGSADCAALNTEEDPAVVMLIFMVVLWFLPAEFADMKLALLIVSACPTGSNVAVYAQLYDSDYSYAVETVILSTLLSVTSIPVIVCIAEMIRFI